MNLHFLSLPIKALDHNFGIHNLSLIYTSGDRFFKFNWALGYIWEARFVLPRRTFAFLPLFFFFSQNVWLFNQFSTICESRALFTDPQISLFNNFFIKNGFHGTIYTFKNYFVTVFFSFQLYPNGPLMCFLHSFL